MPANRNRASTRRPKDGNLVDQARQAAGSAVKDLQKRLPPDLTRQLERRLSPPGAAGATGTGARRGRGGARNGSAGRNIRVNLVDLRSDTLTMPTEGMRRAMSAAQLGDDVFGEDPTINRLQQVSAELLGK